MLKILFSVMLTLIVKNTLGGTYGTEFLPKQEKYPKHTLKEKNVPVMESPVIYTRTIVHPVQYSFISANVASGTTDENTSKTHNVNAAVGAETQHRSISVGRAAPPARIHSEKINNKKMDDLEAETEQAAAVIFQAVLPEMKVVLEGNRMRLNDEFITASTTFRPTDLKKPHMRKMPTTSDTPTTKYKNNENRARYTKLDLPTQIPKKAASYRSQNNDQQRSATGHSGGGKKNTRKASSSGSDFEAHHEGNNEEKGEKGYEKNSEHEKVEKGHHDKESHAGEYSEDRGQHKKMVKAVARYGEHHKGQKGEKGKKIGQGKQRKKGHTTHGEHNIVQKNEFIKSTKFYNEDHDDEDKREQLKFHDHHAVKKGDKKEEGQTKKEYVKQDYGKKGHHDKGQYNDEHSGNEHEEGHEHHHGHEEKHGQNKGYKNAKKWKKSNK